MEPQAAISPLHLSNYPLSHLDFEFDEYFKDIVEPYHTSLPPGDIDQQSAYIEEHHEDLEGVCTDYPRDIIEEAYLKRLRRFDAISNGLRGELGNGTHTGIMSLEEQEITKQQIKEVEKIREKNRRQMLEFRKNVFIPRNFTLIEKNAIKFSLILLQNEIGVLAPYLPYFAIGSSSELLWLLLLYKRTYKSEFSFKWYPVILEELNSLMMDNDLTQITSEDEMILAIRQNEYIIHNVMSVLKIRADLIVEHDRIRKYDLEIRNNRVENEITHWRTDLQSLSDDGPKRPRRA